MIQPETTANVLDWGIGGGTGSLTGGGGAKYWGDKSQSSLSVVALWEGAIQIFLGCYSDLLGSRISISFRVK